MNTDETQTSIDTAWRQLARIARMLEAGKLYAFNMEAAVQVMDSAITLALSAQGHLLNAGAHEVDVAAIDETAQDALKTAKHYTSSVDIEAGWAWKAHEPLTDERIAKLVDAATEAHRAVVHFAELVRDKETVRDAVKLAAKTRDMIGAMLTEPPTPESVAKLADVAHRANREMQRIEQCYKEGELP